MAIVKPMTARMLFPNILLPIVKVMRGSDRLAGLSPLPPPSQVTRLSGAYLQSSAPLSSLSEVISWGPPPPSTRTRCRGPPPAKSLNEHLPRSSVTYECGTELSQSLGMKDKPSSEWVNSFTRWLKSATVPCLGIRCGSCTSPSLWGGLKRL